MPRSWLYATTPSISSDNALKILMSFLGAMALALFAASQGQRPFWGCAPCNVTTYAALLAKTVLALLSLSLCTYAAWLTVKQMRQARAIRRLIESQALLGAFARAFDESLTRGEFTMVATGVLEKFGQFFGAEEVRVEIVEPRTGVTVEEFLSSRFPPAIAPEIKAHFLTGEGKSLPAGQKASACFLDLDHTRPNLLGGRRTRGVAAAVTTPLGRIGIVLMVFSKPRRPWHQDEAALLCSALAGLIQTAADHCKRKNREDLERRLSHAERVQAVGTLAGGVAHEFNNILGALLGYGEMALQRAPDGEQMEHYLHEMMSTARRAEVIVGQILTLSRSREQERRPLNLVEAIRDGLPLIAASLPGLEVDAPLVPDDDCRILGHPVELQQVVMNLCKNALEASSGGVRVDIGVDVVQEDSVKSLFLGLLQPGRYVRLRIADNARGISSDTLPHIFEPFFTTKSAAGGTGLGLAAVHGLVTAMDGRIDVASARGEGTVFELYFPHCVLPSTPISQFFAAPRLMLGNGQLIATLKPPCHGLAMHEERIAALGYEPISFMDFGALETWLSTETADLIMLDLAAVPAGQSARDIETMVRGVPVILTSRFGEEDASRPGLALRFPLLREPMSTQALADAIWANISGMEPAKPVVTQGPAAAHKDR